MNPRSRVGVSHAHPTTSRGKCKLDFSKASQPLRGKVFFLDLPSQKLLTEIEQEVTERGGTVEKFFDKKVGYLVTNRHIQKTVQTRAATNSPLTPSSNTAEGVVSPFSHSPAENSKPNTPAEKSEKSEAEKSKAKKSSGPVTRRTRAGTILDSSKSQQKGKKVVKMLDIAREWGTKILTPTQLMNELKRMKQPVPVQPEKSPEESERHYRAPTLRELKTPFMKVTDDSASYRPLLYETETWPLPDPHCPAHACPYDKLKRNGKVTQLSRATGARLTQDLAASLPGPAAAVTTRKKSAAGYCECCTVRYEDLNMHLQSKKHRSYATDSENFASLDQFASENGLDHETFLAAMREKYGLQDRERSSAEPCTPPGSPLATPLTPRSDRTPSKSRCGNGLKDKYTITAGITSPKRGTLCIQPIKLAGKGSAQLSGHINQEVLSGTKQVLNGDNLLAKPHPKDGSPQPAEDVVPESPQKLPAPARSAAGVKRSCPQSPLCNIQRLVCRGVPQGPEGGGGGGGCGQQPAASPKKRQRRTLRKIQMNKDFLDEVTRDSPLNSSLTLSPGTSPVTRKSPRVPPRPHPHAPPTPTRPAPSLMLSFSLKDVRVRQTTPTLLAGGGV